MWNLFEGDCLEIMRHLPSDSIDMILCDLPYGITDNKWDSVIPFEPLWEQYRRLIKPTGAIVLTSQQPFSTALINSNKKWFRYELIWDKVAPVGFLNANRKPLNRHESILVFYGKLPTYNPQKTAGKPYESHNKKGTTNYGRYTPTPTINKTGERYPTSILRFPKDSKNRIHPTQKPVALFEYLIRTYTNEGETVLDNCAGSGTTGEAAARAGRKSILIEREEEYCQAIWRRLVEASKN